MKLYQLNFFNMILIKTVILHCFQRFHDYMIIFFNSLILFFNSIKLELSYIHVSPLHMNLNLLSSICSDFSKYTSAMPSGNGQCLAEQIQWIFLLKYLHSVKHTPVLILYQIVSILMKYYSFCTKSIIL